MTRALEADLANRGWENHVVVLGVVSFDENFFSSTRFGQPAPIPKRTTDVTVCCRLVFQCNLDPSVRKNLPVISMGSAPPLAGDSSAN
jgi:hypothetical protein